MKPKITSDHPAIMYRWIAAQTLHNTSSWRVEDDPFTGGPFSPQVGGNNLRIKRVMLTLGYRW